MDVPMKYYWMDRPIEDLSREELIEALKCLGRELESTRGNFFKFMDFHRKVVDYQKRACDDNRRNYLL